MTFEEILDQAVAMLQRRGRATYRTLKLQFKLDDEIFEALKDEFFYSQPEIADDGRGLIWTGDAATLEVHARHSGDGEGRFQSALHAVMMMLHRDRRVTYRSLQHIFSLDDSLMAEVRKELTFRQLAIEENDEGLVWTGVTVPSQPSTAASTTISPASAVPQPHISDMHTTTNGPSASPMEPPAEPLSDEQTTTPQSVRSAPEAERRQLTVMFCDLVGSTDLSGRFDPEDLRAVVRAYQETAAEVIERYEGHIAQYLGDGLLIYFGYPVAHEDDAQRAVHTGLGIVEAMGGLNARLQTDYGVELAVRIGIHTGPVVVGEMGGGGRHEHLAVGETPNIAARLEALAAPNAVVISAVTAQLAQRAFVLEALGPQALKGVAEPMPLYAVLRANEDEPDDPATILGGGFDALVGRDEEIGLLLRRWEQSKEGLGQVVLISGEAGFGKSSLVDGLRRRVRQEGLMRLAFRCSPYHTNSAFYPIIGHLQRALGWQPDDPADTKIAKLEQALVQTSMARHEAIPLLAGLLSLPLPEARYPALTLSPQEQRQKTQDAVVAWLLEAAERHAVLAVWEDLHWADPSTLETLGLLVEQAPTVAMMNVLTFRTEFQSPWPLRSHLTPITLNRLERPQVEALIPHLAQGKALPAEVIEHIIAKTDGIPLYIEELTKMLLASDRLREEADAYVLTGPLTSVAIPDTLQDSLMARLDQLDAAKEVAQLGAVIGREFSYDMLQAIASQDETTMLRSLSQLVEAELLYQRGRPPKARYIFKHALIQEAAYTSLLKSTRQHMHQRIAESLVRRFTEIADTQPELVAHHYMEAGCHEQAITYWRQAGQRALERSAHLEAIGHLTQGLHLLPMLADTPDRAQHELRLQLRLGASLIATQGHAAPEVGQAYGRARTLCQQLGDTPHLFQALGGEWMHYSVRAEHSRGRELAAQLLSMAQRQQDSEFILQGHTLLGTSLWYLGELSSARTHLESGLAMYDPQQHHHLAFRYGEDFGAIGLSRLPWVLWALGYPDQAWRASRQSLDMTRSLAHPFSLCRALHAASVHARLCRDRRRTLQYAEECITLATAQGFPVWLIAVENLRNWALDDHYNVSERVRQIRRNFDNSANTFYALLRPLYLGELAETYGQAGQIEQGLGGLDEALAGLDHTAERIWEAELHRLKGELLCSAEGALRSAALAPEACFRKAIDIARQQQAKSWELRAATSLARLWQSQGKRQEAYDLLAPVYGWFTEGFDTADLQDAKNLLSELNIDKKNESMT